jgi:hypothetical protein
MTQTLLANPRPELGLMYQPGMGNDVRPFQFWQFACDNGRFAKPNEWNAGDWLEWLAGLRRYRDHCLFAVAPDVVGDALATLNLSRPYLETIRQLGYRAAFVAQDGFHDAFPDPRHVRRAVRGRTGRVEVCRGRRLRSCTLGARPRQADAHGAREQ